MEAGIGDTIVHHLDDRSRSGHLIRYFVIDLPDGRWIADSQVLVKKNGRPAPYAQHSDAFIAALGPRARAIAPRDR